MKKLYMIMITFVITGLMITSATSISLPNDSKETQQGQAAQSLSSPGRLVNAVKRDSLASDVAPLSAEIQITGGDYDEYHPSIAVDNSGRFFAAFDATEDGSTYSPMFVYSDDGGASWDGGGFTGTEDAKKPDVDVRSSGFYATFDPPAEYTGSVWVVDATNPSELSASWWDWTDDNILDFEDLHIATFTHAGEEWNWGCIAFTGYNGYGTNDWDGNPFIAYQTTSDGSATVGWITNTEGCKHASVDIDAVTNMSYALYDRDNAGKYELFLRKDDFGKWNANGGHVYVTSKRLLGTGNVTYPDVIADSNRVIVVAQSDVAGNQDIICYYSTNGMNTVKNTIITNNIEDELYPQITWVTTEIALCSYIRGTEAYYKITQDGGVTWSAEERVSDEQISPVEDHALTISGVIGQAYSIWQDGRGTNVDIYMDSFYNVAAPNVAIGTVVGGFGKVTMQIQNTGTAEATNVDWSITVTGGRSNKINIVTTGTIPSLAAGGSQTVQTDKFIFGLGSLSIQLTADRATASKTGKIFLFLVTNLE